MSYEQVKDLLEEGRNCWRVETATYASMVVDCGNYYRDIHESIMKARHSIFIVGWDIDSRVRLVRGDHKKNLDDPETLFDLIVKKASENPDLQVYMNQWNNTIMFASDREFLPALKWRKTGLPNIHWRFDNVLPFHASHHQKIVVIDDEVAYTGGIDIGIKRWDSRLHEPFNEHRFDPMKSTEVEPCSHYIPNHDINIAVAGPAAQALAELARKRWKMAADYEAIPLRPYQAEGIPSTWPDTDPPDFTDIKVGVAMTFFPLGKTPAVRQIENLYIDEINRAEKFIYMENQYFAHYPIAAAINQRLKDIPELRVLLFSSRDPQGTIEEVTMWYKRIRFKKIVERGGVGDRVAMVYSFSTDGRKTMPLHVHSKIMIVDDTILHIGSSNINSRSMMLDSECDLSLLGHDVISRTKIADIRNDLIREHSGMEKSDIQALVDNNSPIDEFLKDVPYSTQHLRRCHDIVRKGTGLLKLVADQGEPKSPHLPPLMETLSSHNDVVGFPHKRVAGTFLALMLLVLFMIAWKTAPAAEFITVEGITTQIDAWKSSPWAFPLVVGLFVVAGFFFIPVTLMIAATAMAFGPWTGFLLALSGSLASAFTTFLIGYAIGDKVLRNWTNTAYNRISMHARNAGVMGIAALRVIPLAPFTLVNMVLGVTNIKALPFIVGTFLGLLPGTIAMVVLGDSLATIWISPDLESLLYVGMGILLWLGIVILLHYLVGKPHNEARRVQI